MEWLQLPSWLIYHVGSGHAFFLAEAIFLAGFFSFLLSSRKTQINHPARLTVAAGAIILALSSCPLPWWFYALWAVIGFAWLWLEENEANASHRWMILARSFFACCWIGALVSELPFHMAPTIATQQHAKLTIIGDSVSAGLGEETEPWPALLAKQRNIEVVNLAVAGANARSALEQANRMTEPTGIILVEIGGNDLLNGASSEQFHTDLDALLSTICRPGRTVVMLELPLPPLRNSSGSTQRQLSNKHGVVLIPKRAFINVLAAPNATTDGIHLSPIGHQLMADTIWRQIGDAFSELDWNQR